MPAVQGSLQLHDTTLRDGGRQEGLVLTVADKLAVARHLDALGVTFIEGGRPGAGPEDTEFFRRARTELRLENAALAASGATRRPYGPMDGDPQVAALLTAGTPVVTLLAKSHCRHVEVALRTTLEENLAMIRDTVRHLVAAGKRVLVDAEHFFDGYLADRCYALEVVRAAADAGAEAVVLCDTNGGTLPDGLRAVVGDTARATGAPLGIQCRDDGGCAVANTLAAVDAGAVHVQGTAHGYGERCGNADLFSVIANLVLKKGRPVLPQERLETMTAVARAISEITMVPVSDSAPYVGGRAFTHRDGPRASALHQDPSLHQHIEPASVGNTTRAPGSDAGRRPSIEAKARELGYRVHAGSEPVARAAARVEELEKRGYSFEAADASFELLLRDELADVPLPRPFEVDAWRVAVDRGPDGSVCSEAMLKVFVDGNPLTAAGKGNGPVDALDRALHAALDPFFPRLAGVRPAGYRVRVLDGTSGGGATTRVVITFTDGARRWSTVGVDENSVAASWWALQDAVNYVLLRERGAGGRIPSPAVTAAVG